MKKYYVSIIAMLLLVSVSILLTLNTSHAAGGAVAAVVTCDYDTGSFTGVDTPRIENSQITIDAPGCRCDLNDSDLNIIDCDDASSTDDECAKCLGSLVRAGMSIVTSAAIWDPELLEQNALHMLTGPAGPFITRIGGCPCN